jgi:DNA repair and recombination protein RAD52
MTFTPEQIKMLEAKLDPKHVVKPTGSFGPKGDYLEGWHVINEANRIFGFGQWGYTHDLKQVSKETNAKGNIEIGYICNCKLVVGDVTRQDVGYGSGAAKKEGDAHEGAVKEAVTDALKRCLRTFGNPFGLALYDKSQANVGVTPPELSASDKLMLNAIKDAVTLDDLTKWPELHGEAAGQSDNATAIRSAYRDKMKSINQPQQKAA